MILKIKDLSKSYSGKPIVNGLSFNVREGQVVGLLGPNGAGKTTAFYMTIGLIKPDSGLVYFKRQRNYELSCPSARANGNGITSLKKPSIFSKTLV